MSKLLLTLLVVAIGCAVWVFSRRSERRSMETRARTRPPSQLATPKQMVRCEVCGALMDSRLARRSPQGQVCQDYPHCSR